MEPIHSSDFELGRDAVYPGQQIGRYRVAHLIRRGGMGEVYAAHASDPDGSQRRVAIKLACAEIAEDRSLAASFVDEARLAARLEHRNIASILELGEWQGRQFIVMEYVDGASLFDLLARLRTAGERLPERLALFIAAELADGLAYAHRATGADDRPLGIVHRDVSPSNILLSRQGEVKLVDFGIALAAERSQQTAAGVLKGKLPYMAPEQANLEALGPQVDQFALGAVLYEMLEGTPLYAGHDLEVLDQARACDLAALDGASLRPAADRLIRTMLARAPGERFPDLTEVRRAIAEVASDLDPVEDDREPDRLAEVIAAHAGVPRAAGVALLAPTKRLGPAPKPEVLLPAPAPLVSLSPRRRAVLVTLGLVAAAAVIATMLVRAPSGSATPPALQPPAGGIELVLGAWSNRTGDPALDFLETLCPSTIGERLLSARSVRPVFWFRFAQQGLAEPPRPAGAWQLVGELSARGDKLRLDAQLLDGSGQERRSWRSELAGADRTLFEVIAQIATVSTAELGETLPPDRIPPLDPEVAHVRQTAIHAQRSWEDALARFRELALRAPDLAEAYLWAGTMAWWAGNEKGLEYLDGIIEVAQISGIGAPVPAALAIMRGIMVDGHAAWRDRAEQLAREHPDQPFAVVLAAEALVHTGAVREGIAMLERVVELEPTLVRAYHHVVRIALMDGDAAVLDRILDLERRFDPTRRSVDRFELERLAAVRRYPEAIEAGLVRVREAPTPSAELVVPLAYAFAVEGDFAEANRQLGLLPDCPGVAGIAVALASEVKADQQRWIDRCLPGGASWLGTASRWIVSDLRLAAEAMILDIMVGGTGPWEVAVSRLRAKMDRPQAQDRRLLGIADALGAHRRGDRESLGRLAREADDEGSRLAAGLDAELSGDVDGALAWYQQALDVRLDGRFTAVIAHARARAARAAGQHEVFARACEDVLHPRVLEPYFAAATPDCRRWTAERVEQ